MDNVIRIKEKVFIEDPSLENYLSLIETSWRSQSNSGDLVTLHLGNVLLKDNYIDVMCRFISNCSFFGVKIQIYSDSENIEFIDEKQVKKNKSIKAEPEDIEKSDLKQAFMDMRSDREAIENIVATAPDEYKYFPDAIFISDEISGVYANDTENPITIISDRIRTYFKSVETLNSSSKYENKNIEHIKKTRGGTLYISQDALLKTKALIIWKGSWMFELLLKLIDEKSANTDVRCKDIFNSILNNDFSKLNDNHAQYLTRNGSGNLLRLLDNATNIVDVFYTKGLYRILSMSIGEPDTASPKTIDMSMWFITSQWNNRDDEDPQEDEMKEAVQNFIKNYTNHRIKNNSTGQSVNSAYETLDLIVSIWFGQGGGALMVDEMIDFDENCCHSDIAFLLAYYCYLDNLNGFNYMHHIEEHDYGKEYSQYFDLMIKASCRDGDYILANALCAFSIISLYKAYTDIPNIEKFSENIRELKKSPGCLLINKAIKYVIDNKDDPKSHVTKILSQFVDEDEIVEIIRDGESDSVEFKSTLRKNMYTNEVDKKMQHSVLKTICAFLNTNGGKLLIGVEDDGSILGIEKDGFKNTDKFHLHLRDLISQWIGIHVIHDLDISFQEIDGKAICLIDCSPSKEPIYLDNKINKSEEFFVRTGPSTEALSPSNLVSYVQRRFS